MNAGVRAARPDDVPAIEKLVTAEHLPANQLDEFLDTFLVLEDGGHIVGCVGLEPYGEAMLLRSMVVEPGRRGRGEGRMLVEACLAQARSKGAGRVYLFTMFAADFFGRLGFQRLAPEEFESAVRASFQYRAVTKQPALRERITGMVLAMDGGG